MKLTGLTRQELLSALHWVNRHYSENIEFGADVQITEVSWRVRLKVLDRLGPGSSRTVPNPYTPQNYLASACWHVHYAFWLEIPNLVVVSFNPLGVNGHRQSWVRGVDEFPTWEEDGHDVRSLCACSPALVHYEPVRRLLGGG